MERTSSGSIGKKVRQVNAIRRKVQPTVNNLAATVADKQIPEDFRISGNGIRHGCTAFHGPDFGRTPAPREVHLRPSFGQPFRESIIGTVPSAGWSSKSY